MVVVALRGPRIRAPPNVFATLIRCHFNGLRGPPVVGAPSATHEGVSYLGKAGEDFDRTEVTGMLIQVKNSKNKNAFNVEMEHYQHMFDLGLPMITLLVDLGVKKYRVERVPSFCEHIFVFRVSGVSMETYNCIASDRMEKNTHQNP
jgi:hypothetical protein